MSERVSDTVPPERVPAPGADDADAPASQEPAARDGFVERAWAFFASLKLLIALVALLALAMAVGTFVNPREDALANIEQAFADRPLLVALYRTFELYSPFRSWWFTLLLLLLAINAAACSIERLPRIWLVVRRPETRLSERVLRTVRNKREVPRGALEAGALEQGLRGAGWRVRRAQDPDGTVHLFGERGAWARFGVWAVHIALEVVLLGGILGRWLGVEGMLNLPAGGAPQAWFDQRKPDGTALRHEMGFQVRCDEFRLETFADGSPRRFASDLTVLDLDGKELAKKTIAVNEPLDWGKLRFYQASYQERRDLARVKLTLRDKQTGETRAVRAEAGRPVAAADGVRFTVEDYREKLGAMGAAVQVARAEGDAAAAKQTRFWVYADHPRFDGDNRTDRWALSFEGLEPGWVTGIQVGYDPGVPWIYAGCAVIFLGLFVAFFTSHRRVWVKVGQDRVAFAGASHRNPAAFQREFEALLERLGAAPARAGE